MGAGLVVRNGITRPGSVVFEAAVEKAAEDMYAAGPWGEFGDAHDIEVYRDLAREAIGTYIDELLP